MDRVVVSVRTIAEFSMESGDLYPNMDAYERMQDGFQAHKRLQMAYGEGAKAEDVKLLKSTVGQACGVKASGGIRTAEQFQEMIDAGADRIGTSAGKEIAGALQNQMK